MSRHFIKASGTQQRKDRVSAVPLMTTLTAGTYGGFWDITEPGGAFSIANVEPVANGSPINRVPQLLVGGTASDLVIKMNSNQTLDAENTYRRDYVSPATGYTYPRKPVLFYSAGFFQQPNAFDNLRVTLATAGVPGGTIITEQTVALYGVKLLHELGSPQEFIDAFDTAGRSSFPVPIEPGSLVIVTKLAPGHNTPGQPAAAPLTEVYVNGVLLDSSAVASQDPIDPAIGIDPLSFLNMFAYPCWGTQKLLLSTRAFTAGEALQVHNAFLQCAEVYT